MKLILKMIVKMMMKSVMKILMKTSSNQAMKLILVENRLLSFLFLLSVSLRPITQILAGFEMHGHDVDPYLQSDPAPS